jgi:hypothetical protein
MPDEGFAKKKPTIKPLKPLTPDATGVRSKN